MAYVYLIVALSWLLGLLCLAVLLAPPVLWFLHRRDANFARPVRWVARIDLAFILSWFVSFFFFNLRFVLIAHIIYFDLDKASVFQSFLHDQTRVFRVNMNFYDFIIVYDKK